MVSVEHIVPKTFGRTNDLPESLRNALAMPATRDEKLNIPPAFFLLDGMLSSIGRTPCIEPFRPLQLPVIGFLGISGTTTVVMV